MGLAVIRKHYQITLPVEIRKTLHCKEGDLIELVPTKHGVVLKTKVLVDKDQAWFWSKEWQEGEREADKSIKEGTVLAFKNIEEMRKSFEK